MTEPLRLILVEDSADDADLILRELRRGGFAVESLRVESEHDLRAQLVESEWDILITDYRLPGFDAPGALRVRRELRPDLPAIVVSGTIGEDVAVETLKAGAGDYLLKGNLMRLAPAVRREIAEAAERRRLIIAEEALRRSEERLRFHVDQTPTVNWMLDRDLRFTLSRGGGLTRLGLEPDQVLGMHVYDYLGGATAAADAGLGLAMHERALAGEAFAYDQPVGDMIFEIILGPLRSPSGEIDGVIGVAYDATERKLAEADVLRSQRELTIRNRIAEAFLTTTGDEGFDRALGVVLDAMDSPLGLFAYIDADGAAVIPTFRGEIWEGCRVDGKANRFPAGTWKDLVWARALQTGQTVVSNSAGRVPQGHIAITRAIVTPLTHGGEAIGHFELANKPVDYDQDDIERLEKIAAYVAPILHARLELRREEAAKNEALRERETIAKHFEYLTRQANDAIVLLDESAHVLEVNDRAVETYGYSQDEMCRLTVSDLRVPDNHAEIENDFAAARAEHGTIFETIHRRRDGSTFPVEVSSRLIELDGTHYYQSIIRDISERKLAEELGRQAAAAMAESEQRYRTLFEQSPVGVFVTGADLVIVDCNGRLSSMLKQPRESLVGYALRSLPEKEAVKALEKALSGKRSHYEGHLLATEAHGELFLSLRCAPMHNGDGAVTGIVGVVADLSERRRFISTINKLANQDAVTGLPNQGLFNDRLRQAIAHAEREREKLAVAVVDLDRFKQVNDMLGRQGGDKLLKAVGKRLTSHVSDGDTVAGVGSDEFHILVPGIGGIGDMVLVADKLLESFSKPWRVNKEEVFSGASIGIAIFPDDAQDLDGLVKCADGAMRMAKRDGGHVWRLFDQSMGVLAAERQRMENALHHAIEERQFVVYFQPIVAAADGRIESVESLVRWQDPERGLVPPLDFIPLAEETGMIVSTGEQILAMACDQLVAWQKAGHAPVRGAVNLSARQFRQRDLVAMVKRALTASGLKAKYLELEVTESTAMDDPEYSIGVLRQLRSLGISIALDDFGTGYSSLALLGKLPLDVIKIDRAFVSGVTTTKSDASIVSAVIALGHQLGLTVVGEGVETAAQLQFLREHGCDRIQGFFFSRPLSGGDCTPLIAAGSISA